jgi:hypothetical protein
VYYAHQHQFSEKLSFEVKGINCIVTVAEQNTYLNFTLASEMNLCKCMEIAQQNEGYQKFVSSYFFPKLETEHSNSESRFRVINYVTLIAFRGASVGM